MHPYAKPNRREPPLLPIHHSFCDALMQELGADAGCWDTLARCDRPLVLYGMGDGADKIAAVLEARGIPVAGVCASDGFVRGHSFRGFVVESLSQARQRLTNPVFLLCFATQRPEVLAQVRALAAQHTLYAPDVPVCGGELFDFDFLRRHRADIDTVYNRLADEASRRVFHDVIAYKLTGRPDWLWDSAENAADFTPALYRLIAPGTQEYLVDAGAYTGDTVAGFLSYTGGQYRRILALEPDRRNFRRLSAAVGALPRVICLPTGAWHSRDTLPFTQSTGRQNRLDTTDNTLLGGALTPVDAIDNLLDGADATIIKYDVEGAEEEALRGSAETIRRYHPALIISAYHRSRDIFTLPLQALSLHSGYRLYLRRPPYIPAWDLCYICVDGNRQ